MSSNFHERLEQDAVPLPSDRSTGLVFTVVALVVAYLWRSNETVLYAAGIAAGVLAAVSLLVPRLLHPLNVGWMKFALIINKVMSPIIMLVLFAVAIVPAGLLMQLRADPLRRRRQPDANSYWIERERDMSANMANQF